MENYENKTKSGRHVQHLGILAAISMFVAIGVSLDPGSTLSRYLVGAGVLLAFPAWVASMKLPYLFMPFLSPTDTAFQIVRLSQNVLFAILSFVYFAVISLPTLRRGRICGMSWWILQPLLLLPGITWGIAWFAWVAATFPRPD